MPKRPATRQRGAITPESRVSLNITQLIMMAGAIASIMIGLGTILINQSTFKDDVTAMKVDVKTVAEAATNVSKEQDTKREQMGKDFLASNKEISARVADLHDAQVVQQMTTKQMADTLTTISNQLGSLSLASGHGKGR